TPGHPNAAATLRSVVFLDADDYVQPTFLQRCWEALYEGHTKEGTRGRSGSYVPGFAYTDWIKADQVAPEQTSEWSEIEAGGSYLTTMPHPITCMIDINALTVFSEGSALSADGTLRVQGFDPRVLIVEDRDYFMRLRERGVCGVRVPEPLL